MISSTPATALIKTKRKTDARCSQSCRPGSKPGSGTRGAGSVEDGLTEDRSVDDRSADNGSVDSSTAVRISCAPGTGLSPTAGTPDNGAPDNGVLESVLTRGSAIGSIEWRARFRKLQDVCDEDDREQNASGYSTTSGP